MGLDAVVYKHRTKFPVDPERFGLLLENQTGEWYSETGDLPEPLRVAGVEALHKRLGNVGMIAGLLAEASAFLPASSLLLSVILHEGGQAGTIVPLGSLEELITEVSLLRTRAPEPSAELTQVLRDLEDLARAAEENGNPIVFV